MSIFESLENLNVSEGCFEEIFSLIEEYASTEVNTDKEKLQKFINMGVVPRGYEVSDEDRKRAFKIRDNLRAKAKAYKAHQEKLAKQDS